MEEPTCEIHPFSYSSAISNEAKEVNPMYGMEESVSFGRFTSESLSWEKWSTFNRNRYVEEAEKYSRPGSVKQKKAFLEAHFKRMTTLKDATASPDQANAIQEPPDEQNVDDTTVGNDHNELKPSISDQQWVEKEVEVPDFGADLNEDKPDNGEVQLTDLMDVEKQNPVTETENGLIKTQESGLQSSSINQEDSAPALIKRTPLSSYIPPVVHPVKEIDKKRSSLYKLINSKLIKKIGLSSKTSKNSHLKTPPKEKPKDRLCQIFLCGSKPQSNSFREEERQKVPTL